MKTGVLFYNKYIDRMDIMFADKTIYEGLHCGECFEVKIKGKYIPTRIEKSNEYYLVDTGLKGMDKLIGLHVRTY